LKSLNFFFEPGSEEHCEAMRLEGRGRPILRDAQLRCAPQSLAENASSFFRLSLTT